MSAANREQSVKVLSAAVLGLTAVAARGWLFWVGQRTEGDGSGSATRDSGRDR